MVYTPASKHPHGARLLALDGGGVRGIVALELLHEVMIRLQRREKLKDVPRPVDYFELAAGTSTGGIIGIMLFRLRMTVHDTIIQYNKIAQDVFSPKIYGFNIGHYLPVSAANWINNSKNLVQNSRFDDADLKRAIDNVVAEFGLDENDRALKGEAPMQHPGAGRAYVVSLYSLYYVTNSKHRFCCTTAQNKAESVLFRTYKGDAVEKKFYTTSVTNDIMRDNSDSITISLAARATSAAPTFFPEVKFPEQKPNQPALNPKTQQLIFWDGGLLNNNPIDQLWYARYELVHPTDPPPAISCVISLGTGWLKAPSPSDSTFRLVGVATGVMDFATNTNAKSRDFTRHMNQLKRRPEHSKSRYVRLQPDLGADRIGLADYTRMADLKNITRKYIDLKDSQKWIDRAVCYLCCTGCEICIEE
jgi:hypothetical protein